ncbi:MAG: acyl carrier protein [Acidobacteriota bacterium]
MSQGHVAQRTQPSRPEIEGWLRTEIARLVAIEPHEISTEVPFDSFGVDSLAAAEINRGLERLLAVELPLSLVDNFDSIEELAEFLAREDLPNRLDELETLQPETLPGVARSFDPLVNLSPFECLDPVYVHRSDVMKRPDWTPPAPPIRVSGPWAAPADLDVDITGFHDALRQVELYSGSTADRLRESIEGRLGRSGGTGLELHLCGASDAPACYWKAPREPEVSRSLRALIGSRQLLIDEQIVPVDHSSIEWRAAVGRGTIDASFCLLLEAMAETIGVLDHGRIHPKQLRKQLCTQIEQGMTVDRDQLVVQGGSQSLLLAEPTADDGIQPMVAALAYEFRGSIERPERCSREVRTLSWSVERWSVCFTSRDTLDDVLDSLAARIDQSSRVAPAVCSERGAAPGGRVAGLEAVLEHQAGAGGGEAGRELRRVSHGRGGGGGDLIRGIEVERRDAEAGDASAVGGCRSRAEEAASLTVA